MRAVKASAIAFGIGLCAGCPSVGSYQCRDQADCDRSGSQGVCLEDEACAYPDQACPSGWSRSPNAADDAGSCLDLRPTTTADGSSSISATSGSPAVCGFRKAIELDTAVLSSMTYLEAYPLLLSFTDEDLVGQDPDSLYWTDANGSALARELDTFDPVTGTVSAWVRLPAWSPGDRVTVYMRWGEPAGVPEAQTAQVWEPNYVGVWHLGDPLDDSDGEVIRNSIAGGGHGFAFGNMGAEQSVPGAIGAGLRLDGDDDYVEVDAGFLGALGPFTVSLWIRWDGTNEEAGLFSRLNGEGLMPRCFMVMDSATPRCQLEIPGDVVGVTATAQDFRTGERGHMAYSWDGEVARIYFAGVLVKTEGPFPGPLSGGTETLLIGRDVEFGTWHGMFDEFRVSDRALPDAWIEADFRTQSNPANVVLGWGSAEPVSCG